MNEQITKELFSAYLYLSMEAYLEDKGLSGMATWMRMQSQEEIFHGMKIFNYLNERGERVILGAFEQPESNFKSVQDVFEQALAHEQLGVAIPRAPLHGERIFFLDDREGKAKKDCPGGYPFTSTKSTKGTPRCRSQRRRRKR